MVEKKDINKICEIFIEGKELTTKELNSNNINSKKIKQLIETNIIERTKRGHYILTSTKSLYAYGMSLIWKKDHDNAYKCFEECYKLDNNFGAAAFQLFSKSLRQKNYDNVIKYLNGLGENKEEFKKDKMLYIYLLNMIIDLPDEYKKIAKSISFNDIKVNDDDKRFGNVVNQNNIRNFIFEHKYLYAIKILNQEMRNNKKISVQNIVIKNLLDQVLAKENERRNEVLRFIKDKNYADAINILEQQKEKNLLSLNDNYILDLAKILINYKNTGKLYNNSNGFDKNVYDAINNANYKRALELSAEYSEKYNLNKENIPLLLLLIDINNITNKKTETKTTNRSNLNKNKTYNNKILNYFIDDIYTFEIEENKNIKVMQKTK